METIPCIFGHGYSDDIAIEENGFQGRRCPQCRTIYISPRPRQTEIFDLYHHDKAYLPAAHHIRFNPAAELAARAHFLWICDKNPLARPRSGKRYSILEIGCGGGHLLKVAKESGWDTYGVELNPHQARHVRENLGIPCETIPFSQSSFGDKKFDIIFHCDVTSHLADPIRDFSTMREKLNENGQLIFETGNGADIDARYYKYFQAWQYPDHLFFFGESSIRELLTRSGFQQCNIKSWSILPQLALTRATQRLKNPIESTCAKEPQTKPASDPGWKQRIKRHLAARATHFVRFSLGALSSNPKTPRTMIVWASPIGQPRG